MGLEALSRGCSKGYFNDLGKKAYTVTKQNCKALGYDKEVFVTNLDYRRALELYKEPFDLIFLDPSFVNKFFVSIYSMISLQQSNL